MSDPWTVKRCVSPRLARDLMQAAEAAVTAHGWNMYVAIVDDAGTPLLVQAIEAPQQASYEISVAKARSAVRFRRATKVWEERVKGGAPNVMTLPGVIASEGGVPLLHAGQVVGAVGVSGGTGVEDGIVAAAVVEALARLTA